MIGSTFYSLGVDLHETAVTLCYIHDLTCSIALYLHTCTWTCTYASHIHAHIHTHIHTHIHIHIHTHIHIHIHTHNIHIYVYGQIKVQTLLLSKMELHRFIICIQKKRFCLPYTASLTCVCGLCMCARRARARVCVCVCV